MKKVGIIGGIGPEATVMYYQAIVREFQKRVGSRTKLPELAIDSIDMYKMFDFLEAGNTDAVVDYIATAVNGLAKAGADFVAMCGNTPHIVFDEISANATVPMLSIVETASERSTELGLKNLGLLGTTFTMRNNFFATVLKRRGIQVSVPNEQQQEIIHHRIVTELENGIVRQETKDLLIKIVNSMRQEQGIDGVVLGCTELPLALNQSDFNISVLDIAQIHIDRIVDTILEEE